MPFPAPSTRRGAAAALLVLALGACQDLPTPATTEPPGAPAFALTGGLLTRTPRTVERVKERTPVGNLYVNRAITGAMVARQPFGGNRLSGTGRRRR